MIFLFLVRSPVFTHLNATLQGLTTIRAFRAQGILSDEFDKHQDYHSSAWYMFISASSAFGFSLDLCCSIFVGFITFSYLVIGNDSKMRTHLSGILIFKESISRVWYQRR